MATEFLRTALLRIEDQQNYEALYYFIKTQEQATEAVHLCINFQGLLKSIRMMLFSSTFIESAVEIDGMDHWLPSIFKTVHFRSSLLHPSSLPSREKV